MLHFICQVASCAALIIASAEPPGVLLDDFEAGASGWKFVGGEEFPGAKGSFSADKSQAHSGVKSYRLDADFRGGGAYVGCRKDLESQGRDVAEFRLWVRGTSLERLGVRVSDETGQCHQSSLALPTGYDKEWREVVLRVRDLVGGEHWGGANDGKWHGPPKGIGFNIGRNALTRDSGRASLWIDDFRAVPVAPGRPTLRAGKVAPTACQPGDGTRFTFTWDAAPLGANCNVFVHFVNANGQMVFQADHAPPTPTIDWSGRIEYGKTVAAPTDVAPGRYDVVVGLWDPAPASKGGARRLPFNVGEGLKALPGDACRMGALEISPSAPLPKLPAPTLKLDDFKLRFAEEFDGPLSVSAWGPGTRWIAHTPYAGDFGDAGFADPEKGFPFKVEESVLQIEARKVGGRWRSGLLSSVDSKGNGFSQKFGYFEMRAKFPKGPGTWPAFWLMGVPQLTEPRDRKTLTQIEIDVVEQYGVGPNALHTTVHLWGPGPFHWADGDTSIVRGMGDDFHRYGVLVEEKETTFYFDGAVLRTVKTPKEAKVPLYLMLDLALGGGWPIDKTPDPSRMLVDYVRVYARR